MMAHLSHKELILPTAQVVQQARQISFRRAAQAASGCLGRGFLRVILWWYLGLSHNQHWLLESIGLALDYSLGIVGLVWAESPESSQCLYWKISELFGILVPFYRQGSTLCRRDKPSDNKWYPLLHSQKGFRWNWKLQRQHIQYAKMRLDSTC